MRTHGYDSFIAREAARIPLWAKILLSLLVLLLLVALAVPYFLDVDRYRDTIAEALAKQMGRKVTLGKIQARLFPGVGVTVGDCRRQPRGISGRRRSRSR